MVAELDWEFIRLRPSRATARLMTHTMLQGRPLTTKARWLNPLIFGQFTLVKRLPPLQKVKNPIFILGTGRSGTTILGKLLAFHPHINFLNEPKALWHSVYPKEDIIGSYNQGEARYRLYAEDATPSVKRAAHQLYGYALAITGSKRIVDKYPEMIFRLAFIYTVFPDAKCLFLVRNGWDTCSSIQSWSKKAQHQSQNASQDWWGANQRKWHFLLRDIVQQDPELSRNYQHIANFTRQEDMAAIEWIVTMREGLNAMQSGLYPLHCINYENLVDHPDKTMRDLFEFCELPPDNKVLEYAKGTLKPSPPKNHLEIDTYVQPIFQQTMLNLGY